MATVQGESTAVVKRDVVDLVAGRVRQFIERGELQLPPDYSAENALKGAWLTLQFVTDKQGKPALQVCTRESIANSLLDMVVQGLNPQKRQCYFVVFGNKLVLLRSYFGSMALVKRIIPDAEIWFAPVYEGDELEYAIERGRKRILKHVQRPENVRPDRITAAYCVIEHADGRPIHTEIMTIDQIKRAWAQGQNYQEHPEKPGTHQKFPDQMAVKTVINRACKYVINASSDSYLLRAAAARSDEELAEAEIEEEVAANANGAVIDVEVGPPAPEPEGEPQEAPREPASAPEPPAAAGAQQQLGLDDPGF